MGRGKKKDKKEGSKPEDLPISGLSISEDQPSTSQLPPAQVKEEEEEEGGLGLTGGTKKKKTKQKSITPEVEDAKPASSVLTPAPPSETSLPNPEEEEEGGLGLGGARKKRPRKKKASAEVVSSKRTESQPSTGPSAAVLSSTTEDIKQPVSGPGGPPPGFGATREPSLAYDRSQGRVRDRERTRDTFPSLQPAFSQAEAVASEPSIRQSAPWESQQLRPQSTLGSSAGRGRPREQADLGRPREQPGLDRPREQLGLDRPREQLGLDRPREQPNLGRPREQPDQKIGTASSSQFVPAKPKSDKFQSQDTTLCRFKIPPKINVRSPNVPSYPIKVLANYLPMKIEPLKIFRYDVTFKPERPKKLLPKAYEVAKAKLFPKDKIAFDQMKNCYSLTALAKVTASDRIGTVAEIVDPNGKTMSFEVSFKATGIVDLTTIINYMKGGTSLSPPTEAIQCVDVILRQGTLESYVKAGRQFFKRPLRPIELGMGLEMWTGLFQSAVFTTRPFINIDVAHKGFPKNQPLVNALINDFNLKPNMPIEQQRGWGADGFKTFIKGLKVLATIGGDYSSRGQKREFICNELVDPPTQLKFTFKEESGREVQMSVADYFAKEKKIRLKYPQLNCMWVGPRDKKIYYPLELLEVSYGQALNKQLNEKQLSTMVKEAATPPDERKRKIEEVIDNMDYSRNQYFKSFGLKIEDEFFTVEAKVLKPPKLEVGGGMQIEPRRGAWQANKLLRAQSLDSWGFVAIDLDPRASNSDYIINQMVNVGMRLGMRVSAPPKENLYYNISVDRLQRVFSDALSKGLQLLIIVVATRGRDTYHFVKKYAERDIGILTQCIKEYTAQRRMNEQTVKNILLKVNSKLMGVNQALDVRSMPKCLSSGHCMVVGADVTHPSPDQSSVPSIAAVTASLDRQCFRYNIQLSVQTPKMEVIVEFEDMMVEHLKVYRNINRALPTKIFVFRDGVSEGQFAIVMNSELQAVHNAYKALAGPEAAKPEVLFMLVQKRHHTRFFVPNSSNNVEPGTVVDKDIVHARELDFYLVSHQAIKGTARPTRYHAVCNDGKIPDDEVEQLTYYLCHLYSRCMRAVSYPTPTYYAHLACLRARSLTHGERFNNADLERRPQRLRVMDRILEISRMFFV